MGKRQNILFTTNSNKRLVKKLARNSNLRIGDALVDKYADGEIKVKIEEIVIHKKVYVLGSVYPPAENLMELLLLIHALKVNKVKFITVIIPYLGYSKSDYIKSYGDSLSAQFVTKIIETAGANKVIVFNLHSRLVESFFNVSCLNINILPYLIDNAKKILPKDITIVAPDKGAINDAKLCAQNLGIKDILYIDKYRPKPEVSKILKIKGDPKGKHILIIDDMVQTGETILNAVKRLSRLGAKDIYVIIPHLVYMAGCISKLNKTRSIKKIIVSNTIPYQNKIQIPRKFNMINISELILSVINNKYKKSK
jgi:ribose-phosphate pyrophosphokinase